MADLPQLEVEIAPPAELAAPRDETIAPGTLKADDIANPKEGVALSGDVDKVKAATPLSPSSGLDDTKSLPTGADKSGVSSQAISVPQGSGKIQGMGESFSAQLSTGIATFSVPLSVPSARGGAQPALGLSYSSSGAHGIAGAGWELGVPFIARQTDRGVPRYEDPPSGGAWHPNMDRFVFNGGQELVPLCTVTAGTCPSDAKLTAEVFPTWAEGWMYFRPRVEGSFLRFFWSPNRRTWVVQGKGGETMEIGVPLDDASRVDALEVDPSNASKIFRWNLVRHYDAQREAAPPAGVTPRPVNVVAYRYFNLGGTAYLSDVWDTPPASGAATASVSSWAHHVRFRYEPRTDPTAGYRRGWRTTQTIRLRGVDVTSKPFEGGTSAPRELVRRYHLAYEAGYHVSLLASVQMEGRCGGFVEDASESLPSTSCPVLPPMKFGYQHVTGYDSKGAFKGPTLPGYEAFDERIRTFAASPPFSLDEELTDLFDLNADGLPDVLVTAPGLFGGKHGAFCNGHGGNADAFGALSPMPVFGVGGADASTITLKNLNVAAADIDGDARIDLVHMPKVKTYGVYTPIRTSTTDSCSLALQGRSITTAAALSPKVDFGKDAAEIRMLDVNGDGLVDAVYSAGTELQTFFSLGRFPSGDGQFGNARFATAKTSSLSNDPVRKCVPWSGTPVRFSDAEIKIGDMNGDGLPDIVKIQKGKIQYWPGRGNGFFGTGAIDDCAAGSFGSARDVDMSDSPWFTEPSVAALRLDDVNGDGLDDLVQVRFTDIDVWLNVDGIGWTDRHTISGTPPAPSYASRVRLVDANGSGTRDVLWGDASNYRYIDLLGGKRPWVLTSVANGLGKTTDLEYASSTELMLADAKAGNQWKTFAPMPLHVVVRETVRDNLGTVGRTPGVYVTEYSYRDPYFDGLQREFRGFTYATVRKVGDSSGPTSRTTSRFLLGECAELPGESDPGICTPTRAWEDDPAEALKGLPAETETYDEATGVRLSTTHHTYAIRKLYSGLDGRAVRWAYEAANDTFLYDTAIAAGTPTEVELEEIRNEARDGVVKGTLKRKNVKVFGSSGRVQLRSEAVVDDFGNETSDIEKGCIVGCAPADETITAVTLPGRPAGDTSGWMFRTVHSYVLGSHAPGRRHEKTFSYDAHGNLLATQAVLAGTIDLDPWRFHENTSAIVAGAPLNHSTDGTIALGSTQYDELGNVTLVTGPNHRCRSVGYDTTYKDLPTTETVFAGPSPTTAGACGAIELTSSATYDRGFEAIRTASDLHGELSEVVYDGFGRTVQLTKPDPVALGSLSARPSVLLEYYLPAEASKQPYSLLHTRTQDGATPADDSYRESWAYVDGLGRTIVTLDEADVSANDEQPWIASGLSEYDAKGETVRSYLPWFWAGPDPTKFMLTEVPPTAAETARYDAFGRPTWKWARDGAPTAMVYHALSEDVWDAEDLKPSIHYGTYASLRKDGHGRTIVATERIVPPGSTAMEERDIRTEYLSTGEVAKITRVRVGMPDAPVVRWIRYDTLGRMVLNVEPNTSSGFTPDPNADASTIKAWRYAYDDNGELVGTADARGCGVNYFYDSAGRLTGEDFSPCLNHHQPYSSPSFTPGAEDGLEVLNRYDYPQGSDLTAIAAEDSECSIPSANLHLGRLVSVSDRGAHTVTLYDARGRIACVGRRMGKPGTPADMLADRYAPRWYVQRAKFDGADRPIEESTGAKVPELLGGDGKSVVKTHYSARGSVKNVTGSYGELISSITHAADGATTQLVYGDVAHTTTDYTYDLKRRVETVHTERGPPAIWTASPPAYSPAPTFGTSPPTTFQLLLDSLQYTYDDADNPTEIRDNRLASEWPATAKPVTRAIGYDDLYRVTGVSYAHAGGPDAWISPFDAENAGATTDPRRAKPSPHVSFTHRVQSETFAYDWLGNTAATDDDANGFFDRSLGTITNGTVSAGPYQLKSATNEASGSPRSGHLSAKYDGAGHVVSLAIKRNGACLPVGSNCSQRFAYEWDEVGHLQRARRWDTATPGTADDALPSATPTAELAYQYNAGDQRSLKTTLLSGEGERHTVYVFPGLELRRSEWADGEYVRTAAGETPYVLIGGARIARLAYEPETTPSPTPAAWSPPRLHVFLVLAANLESIASEIDVATSETVERISYTAFGGTDSDRRSDRWAFEREDYRYTGKEDDVELGLHYFGSRYYMPALGRWASADPAAVHGAGADLNAYAYVRGAAFRARDPVGLYDVDDWMVHCSGEQASGPAQEARVGAVLGAAKAGVNLVFGAVIAAPITHFVQAASAAKNGDWASAAKHFYLATPQGQAILLAEGAVDTTSQAVMRVPSAVKKIDSGDVRGGASDLIQSSVELALIAEGVGKTFGKARGPKPSSLGPDPLSEAAESGASENSGACFVAGTPVWTDAGLIPIEQAAPEGATWSLDPANSEWGWYTIVRTFRHHYSGTLVRIGIGTSEILATPNHPFCVDGPDAVARAWPIELGRDEARRCGDSGAWVAAGDLKVGDDLVAADGRAQVTVLTRLGFSGDVFNIEVSGAHAYGVGPAGIVVHNKAAVAKPPRISANWRARDIRDPSSRIGCESVARQISKLIGGTIKRVVPTEGKYLGSYRGKSWMWEHHDVVIKDGRVYDAFTGHAGEALVDFVKNFEHPQAVKFVDVDK